MKKLLSTSIIAASLISSSIASAAMCHDNWYAGAAIRYTWAKGKDNFERVLPKHYPGGELFIGYRFYEHVAAELGYFSTTSKSRTANNVTISGLGIANATVKGSARYHGGTLDLLGFLPLDGCWELFGGPGIGLGREKVKFEVAGVNLDNLKQKTRAFWRLKGGAQYMVTDNVGLRGYLQFDGFNSMRIEYNSVSYKPSKFGTTIGLGAFVTF